MSFKLFGQFHGVDKNEKPKKREMIVQCDGQKTHIFCDALFYKLNYLFVSVHSAVHPTIAQHQTVNK